MRFVVLFALALIFVTRSAAAAEPLLVWHAYRGDEKTALEAALDEFSKARGIPVEALQVPHDAYASKLTAAAPRGHGPHLFIDSHERIGDLVGRGVVAEIPPGENLEIYAPRAVDALRDGERLRGIPIAMKCLALYLNRDLVSETPETLEAIAALGPKLPHGVFPLVYETRNVYFHAAILHAFGGKQLSQDGHFGFVGENAARSIRFVADLMKQNVIPEEATGALVSELFKSGRAATAISGPWFASDLGSGVRYRVVPLPKIEAAGGAPMQPYLTVEAVALTPRGASEPTALELARFIAGPRSSEIRARVGRQVVALRTLPESVLRDEFILAFAKQAEVAIPTPSTSRMRASWVPAESALKKALNGTVEPEAALEEAERRFEDVVRPPPPPASPAPLSVVLGFVALGGAFVLVRRARAGNTKLLLKRSLPAYAWVTHAVIAVGVLVILPLAVGALTSLFAGKLGSMYYVGLANFVEILSARGGPLFTSGSFYLALAVTVLWTVANVSLHVLLGFIVGLLLSRPVLALKPVYRVLLIVPWAVPSYVTALAWRGMFSKQFGAVSALLELVGVEPFSWWSRFSTAFSANLATNVWLGFPFMMVVTLASLTAVPKEVLEAAEVDGATRWQRLWRVTIPMVAPNLLPAVLLGAIWTFNMFNVVYLVSGGEPDGTTDILISEAYRWAFTREAQLGYAAAYAVLIFLLLTFASRVVERVGSRRSAA